jgi:8-oxo-dGTP pyrophosphatase MutT (NUDIX family)
VRPRIADPSVDDLRRRLTRAAHPLDRAPTDPAWNMAELADLIPASRELIPAAVLVPVIDRPSGPTVVLTLRTPDMTHHANQVSFPGGRIEASDRDAAHAAVREAQEEIGLEPSLVEPIGYLDRYATITGFIVTPTLAWVAPHATFAPDQREVAEAFEVPLSYLLDPAQRVMRSREFLGRARHYHVIEFESREIWGATAAMIVNLAERLARNG